ncbi:unnamed protein product, partial [Rotaria sp. Silwood2]
ERFQGPTPINAVLLFGGRQWNSNSLFSYERENIPSKKSFHIIKSCSNFNLRKRKKLEQVLAKINNFAFYY